MKGLFLLCLAAAGAQAATVSEVAFTQDRRTRDVTVTYQLSNEDAPAYVRMEVLEDGVCVDDDLVVHAEGDLSQTDGTLVQDDGAVKTIVWHAAKDLRERLLTDASVRITAYDSKESAPAVYMKIDVSGGPDAATFPVSTTYTPPDLASDACVSNSIWLRRIEPGTFWMGSPETEAGRNASRERLHEVTLTRPFYMGIFEVTRAQYGLVTGRDPGTGKTPLHPVNYIKFNDLYGAGRIPSVSTAVDAGTFFDIIRRKTGLLFDLPTDAQWEYACRAGTTSPFNVDTNQVALADIVWYNGTAKAAVQRVGTRKPNNWGLYDMHGNVWEFCREWIKENLGTEAQRDPITLGVSGGGVVIRGGGCGEGEIGRCRSAWRGWRAVDNLNTSYLVQDGFRLSLTR
jgi:formylglycine-generating enzyme required for sulfatase activity